LDVRDLAWSELADAVWLISATRHAWDRPRHDPPAGPPTTEPANLPPTATGPTPPDDPAAPASADERPPAPGTGAPKQDGNDEPPADETSADEPADDLVQPGRLTSAVDAAGSGEPTDRLARGLPPAGSVLPGALDIMRALRPLKRLRASRLPDEVVLDEVATAEQAAEDGVWWPRTRPETTRWLDLTLVVDGSPSMILWQPLVDAFRTTLEQLGAFRTIRRRLLDTDGVPRLRGGTVDALTRGPAELLTSSGRRIMLVLTDGVHSCWQQGAVSAMLARWGTVMPVAMVHLLPQRLWRRGGPALHRAALTTPRALAPNRHWRFTLPDAWLERDPDAMAAAGTVPVPVLEPQARWLGWWARVVTGATGRPTDGTVLLAGGKPGESTPAGGGDVGVDADGSERDGTSARDQVTRFLSLASPPAFRLATLLAAVPASLPVARLVQAELVPGSGPDHLAEILTSGLVRSPESVGNGHAGDTFFDFPEAVREVLLSGARRSETARVIRVVTGYFGDSVASLRHLQEALDAPDSTPDPEPSAENSHDLMIERIVMRALSGPYLSRASRLSLPADTTGHANVAGGKPSDTVRKMVKAVERSGIVDESTRPPTSHSDEPAIRVRPPAESDVVTLPADRSWTKPATRLAEDAPPVWGNVPPRNPNFTGRAELLEELAQRLAAGGTTVVLPAALHGMGGIGKTQMAVEYIYRHLRDYDVVWWIQAARPAQIRAGLTELAQHLGLPGSAEANTAVPAVREALRLGQPYRRWLLVFDAAESPDVVRPFFPTNGSGEILITSRNPDWAGVSRPLEVAVFERDESMELLKRRGPAIDDDEADRLADKLGDLPLAIEQAAAWCAETGMPVDEYLRLFDEKVEEILDTSAPADYEVSVAAAWNVSFDELRKRSPAAHQLLQVCAFFAPEPISRSLFTGVRGISIAPELDAALRDPMRLSRAIRDINRYGLAKIDHRSDTLILHRLVQVVVRNRMTPQHYAEMCHGAHMLLANLDPNDPASSKQWPRYQDVLPHAYASNVIECDDSWVRQLAINLMRFLYQWGDHQEAERLARQAFEDWSERLGPTDSQTLEAAEAWGYYLFVLGRYSQAAEHNKRTLELRRQVSGDDSEETLSMQTNVVVDLRAQGDFAGALRLTQDAYQKAKALYGEDDPTTLAAAHSHGVSLRFVGEYQQARELDEDTYRRRVEVLGYDNAATFSTLNGLILDRREAGEYSWARAELEKLVQRASTLFGEDSAATLRRFSYLAVARRKDGDHESALELSSRTLERFRQRYGDDQPNVLNCALAYSIDLRHSGNRELGRDLGEQTFDRFRRNFGEHHPHTLAAALDLGVALRLLGDAAAARQLDERSLDQLRRQVGADHPYSIACAINVASDLAAVGEPQLAWEVGTDAIERSLRILGPEHATTLAVAANLALDLRTLGRTQEAETMYADVLTRYRHALGDTHPATIAAGGGIRADCDIDPLPI
jgi:tetratricopeptide (TPR) repeat protein